MIRAGLRLDVLARPSSRSRIIRKRQSPSLRRNLRQLLNDVEERSLIPPRKLPAIRHRTRKNLFRRPVMRSRRIRRRRNRHWRLLLLSCRRHRSRRKSNAKSKSIKAHDRSFSLQNFSGEDSNCCYSDYSAQPAQSQRRCPRPQLLPRWFPSNRRRRPRPAPPRLPLQSKRLYPAQSRLGSAGGRHGKDDRVGCSSSRHVRRCAYRCSKRCCYEAARTREQSPSKKQEKQQTPHS